MKDIRKITRKLLKEKQSGKIIISNGWYTRELDDYEQGEIGGGSHSSDMKHLNGTYDSFEEFISDNNFNNKDSWSAFSGDYNRIDYQTTENENGVEPTSNEIERWKKGEMKLYSAIYSFNIHFLPNPLDAETIGSKLGIQVI